MRGDIRRKRCQVTCNCNSTCHWLLPHHQLIFHFDSICAFSVYLDSSLWPSRSCDIKLLLIHNIWNFIDSELTNNIVVEKGIQWLSILSSSLILVHTTTLCRLDVTKFEYSKTMLTFYLSFLPRTTPLRPGAYFPTLTPLACQCSLIFPSCSTYWTLEFTVNFNIVSGSRRIHWSLILLVFAFRPLMRWSNVIYEPNLMVN